MRSIIVRAPSPVSGGVSVELMPYDPATKEIGPESLKQSVLAMDLWGMAAEVPEVRAAIAAIVAAVDPMKAWVAKKRLEGSYKKPLYTPPQNP